MKRRIALLTLIAASAPALAGFLDWFNGVKLGTPLPSHGFEMLSGAAPVAGKPLLIDFWETTCAPCIQAIPKLNEQHAKYAPQGLQFVGVSAEKKELVEALLKRMRLAYPVAVEGTPSLHKALGIKALPYAIVVDAKGTIVWRGQPHEISEAMLAQWTALY